MKRIIICLLCMVLLCGCAQNTNTHSSEKITVVTTIFPLYDFARAIGGDNIEVEMLIRPGSEVHSYDPLPSDMRSVYDSDLFLYIGGESDTWVDTLLDDGDINSLSLIDTVEQNHHEHNHHKHGHDHTDEHIWTSPENAVIMLRKICESIIAIDIDNADTYRENCDAYIKEIEKASEQMSETVSKYEKPFIVVADRFPFAYLAEQYDIEYEAAFDGCAVSTDISLKTMSRLTEVIKAKNIKAVFCTELSSRNIANALQQEMCVEVIELHSGHNVTLDDFNNGITYVDILYRNINALKRGLAS
ncbi:MAG: zinc ABC transporter substrate-binding protein [Clostridia bacterium]|nr:zinc ABC transporter substrate-binding protein [Clostridia bacterium]